MGGGSKSQPPVGFIMCSYFTFTLHPAKVLKGELNPQPSSEKA